MPKHLLVLILMFFASQAWADPVPGSLEVDWNEGAADCEAATQPPLQVHAYAPRTFILRQNPCVDFEANFLYLLVGSERALLIDSGAVSDPERMPLARQVQALLPRRNGEPLPLLVAHTHGHGDHRAGDAQFTASPSVEIVPTGLEAMRAFYGFEEWPEGTARLDLGGRTVEVLPAPGHHPTHVLFYDRRTALLFSGDFLLPGLLLIDDLDAYHESAARIAANFRDRPVAHVLGGHIELDADGQLFPRGSHHHPDERRLQLEKQDLLALPAALEDFNGFYAGYPDFILVKPLNILLALAASAIVLLALIAWGIRRWWRSRRMLRRR